ncbi:hypothetical protein VTO42DRAFT_7368 [Malbranchea cinnamomea]
MVSGSCLCRNLSYHISEDTSLKPAICHCLDCQKLSGSTYSTNLLVPFSSFDVHGTPKTYRRKGDSGKDVTLNFCDNCGHTLFVTAETMPGLVIVKAGTVDDRNWLNSHSPSVEIYCKDKLGWLPQLAETMKSKF